MKSTPHLIEIIPLGGFGEIGMNCLAIRMEKEILIVDCGVLFPAEPRFGVDAIHATFDYLIQNRNAVVGLVATHGHEDHIAAIPFLLEKLDIPVFTGAYTIGLLQSRFGEFDTIPKIALHPIETDTPFEVGGFTITPMNMPHSTVDNFALIIDRGTTRIFHTSDFKLNMSHPIEKSRTLQQLRSIRPVNLMISDSTGALETTDAGDEDALIDSIGTIVAEAPGRVFIALFSSNIKRINNLLQVAGNNGRKIAMSGRSVLNHYTVGRETGRIPSAMGAIISAQNAHHFRDDELIILMSGTQGESRSALGRLAAGKHSKFTLCDKDTVILSSRFIPGNELAISWTISSLMAQNVRVVHYHNRDHIHVSGHGSKNEIRAAIEAVAPRALLPSHGTYEHMHATAQIARESGVPDTLVATNGDVVSYDDGKLYIAEKISAGRVHIENGVAVPDTILKERAHLSNGGIYTVWISVHDRSGHEDNILVKQWCHGVIPESETKTTFPEVSRIVHQVIKDASVRHPNLPQLVKTAVRRHIRRKFHRNPVFLIDIEFEK